MVRKTTNIYNKTNNFYNIPGTSCPIGGGIVRASFLRGTMRANISGSNFIVSDVPIPSIPKQPAADFSWDGSSTIYNSLLALTHSMLATKSLNVLVFHSAPWQIGALLPPKVISTNTTLRGIVHHGTNFLFLLSRDFWLPIYEIVHLL